MIRLLLLRPTARSRPDLLGLGAAQNLQLPQLPSLLALVLLPTTQPRVVELP